MDEKLERIIKTRLKTAHKFLEGRDLEVYRIFLIADSHFYSQGEFRRYLPATWTKNPTNPKEHRNWKHFDKVLQCVEAIPDCNAEDYLEAVFHRSWDESVTKRKIFPSMLGSEWGITKYANWCKSPLRHKKQKSSTEMKAEAVLNTKRFIKEFCTRKQIDESEFFLYQSPGTIFPDSVLLISQGVVSKYVVSGLKGFWDMVETLDKDVIEEFIPVEDMNNYKRQLRMDSTVYKVFKTVFKE